MSFAIPESVLGIPLFVPTAYDQFQVEAGGLPNGDPCLKVKGNVSNAYRAFQMLPAATPAVFSNGAGTFGWAINFWYKPTVATLPPGGGKSEILFGVGNASQVGPDAGAGWNFGGPSGDSGNTFWCVMMTTAGIAFARYLNGVGNTSGATYSGQIAPVVGAWNMYTINVPASPGAITAYLNGAASGSAGSAQSAKGNITAANAYYFSIGGYGLGCVNRPSEWRIGKLSFHDHILNATERSLLYTAMTT